MSLAKLCIKQIGRKSFGDMALARFGKRETKALFTLMKVITIPVKKDLNCSHHVFLDNRPRRFIKPPSETVRPGDFSVGCSYCSPNLFFINRSFKTTKVNYFSFKRIKINGMLSRPR